ELRSQISTIGPHQRMKFRINPKLFEGVDLVVKMELPGVDPKMVDVRVENNVVTIRGERPFDQKVDQENYQRLERSYGTFARSFTLPATIDSDNIRAEYRDGILSLTLPKSEKAKPKRIQIAATAA